MGTLIDDSIGRIKEHPKEIVTYNIKLTPRQLYKLAVILDHVRIADEDGMADLIKYHPSNLDHDKLIFDHHSLGTTLYFTEISDEEVERMWEQQSDDCLGE